MPEPTIQTDFDPGVHIEAGRAWAAAIAWRQAFDRGEPARWLSFLGKSGTGKTMLAKACVRGIIQAPPAFRGWASVCSWLAKGEWPILDLLREQKVLVLDDISQAYSLTTGMSAFDQKTKRLLGDLLDARLGKWTIVTDNKGLGEIAEFDVRIASRMLRGVAEGPLGVVVEFKECPDYCAARRIKPPPG